MIESSYASWVNEMHRGVMLGRDFDGNMRDDYVQVPYEPYRQLCLAILAAAPKNVPVDVDITAKLIQDAEAHANKGIDFG